MAQRPVFYLEDDVICTKNVTFEWAPGFAISQKKKNVARLHEKLDGKALEVSTKGNDMLGVRLSAFNLRLDGKPLESVFQSSKVFENGGPYFDLLNVSPREAKRDPRLRESGPLVKFCYGGCNWPLVPKSLFYDYIYYNAVMESIPEDELEALLDYKYFSDIEFNPERSINTQARAVAIVQYVLKKYGTMQVYSPRRFLILHREIVK